MQKILPVANVYRYELWYIDHASCRWYQLPPLCDYKTKWTAVPPLHHLRQVVHFYVDPNAGGRIFHLVWSRPLWNKLGHKRGYCQERMSGCWSTTCSAWNSSSSSSKLESKLVFDLELYSVSSLLSNNLLHQIRYQWSSSSSDIWTGRFSGTVKNGILLFEEQRKLISLHTIVLFFPRKIKIGNFCHANYWAKPNAAKFNSSSKLYLLQLYIFW